MSFRPDHLDRARATMVDLQLKRRGIEDPRVLAAMGTVRRELFVLPSHVHETYADCAMPIGEGQTISQPYMVARTCELAALSGNERVLEIGAGSGYQAAVLSHLAREVVSIERIPVLAQYARASLAKAEIKNVEVIVGDGSQGYLPKAPYDRIIVAAAAPKVPNALIDQLNEGGRIIIPVGSREMQRLRVIEKTKNKLIEHDLDACVFVPLIGDQGWTHEAPLR